jgi:hypothetical protein
MEVMRHQVDPLVAVILRSSNESEHVEFVVESRLDVSIVFYLKLANCTNIITDKYDAEVEVEPNSEAFVLRVGVAEMPISYDISYNVKVKEFAVGRTFKRLNEDLVLVIDYDQVQSVLMFEVQNEGLHDYKFFLALTIKACLRIQDNQDYWEVNANAQSTQLILRAEVVGKLNYSYQVGFIVQILDKIPPLSQTKPLKRADIIADFLSKPGSSVQFIEDGKFVDPFFPPSNCSFYGLTSVRLDYEIHWKRPESVLEGEICLFPSKFGVFEFVEGKIDDRWLMVSICHLDEARLKRLFVTQTIQQSGLYELRLCKDREWTTVTIDDLIPCSPSGTPLSTRAKGPELWVFLLEKAIAKLYGSYFALHRGHVSEALFDLYGTSSVSSVTLRQGNPITAIEELADLVRATMTWPKIAQSEIEGTGKVRLSSLHYYSVVKVVEFQGSLYFNLSNPWAKNEWNGDWSSESTLWTSEAKQAMWGETDDLGLTFWMNLKDFFTHMKDLILFSMASNVKETRFVNQLERIGCTVAPKAFYKVVLDRQATVTIVLSQESPKTEGVEFIRPIGAAMLEVRSSSLELITSSTLGKQRDCQLVLHLVPGKFYIIPRIDAFAFVPAYELPENFPLMSEDGILHPCFRSSVLDVFKRFKSPHSEVLSFADFQGIAMRIGLEVSEQQFESDFKGWFANSSEGLTQEGLIELFKAEVIQRGGDAVRVWMERLGYSTNLFSTEARVFNVSMYADETCDIEELPMSELERLREA